MSLRLRGEDGELTPWVPADPLKVSIGVRTTKTAPTTFARTVATGHAAGGALKFLGYSLLLSKSAIDRRKGKFDLIVSDAPGSGIHLLVAPSTAEDCDGKTLPARGFTEWDFQYMCLKTHFRKPLAFSWEALSAARGELADLRSFSAALAGVSLEPSSRGVTGYLHRFREALQRDFDFPEALSCVWDGLRPGALSPGSRAAFLRATLPALDLGGGAESRS